MRSRVRSGGALLDAKSEVVRLGCDLLKRFRERRTGLNRERTIGQFQGDVVGNV
jgi:hypothetical protein